ncbi:MAG: hypothetical protein K8I00_11065 [Candidatus Omnitrophica bacterium]|nr:hypothetical protein [Candidatus Omnitrophota bacterium]
MKLEVSEVVNIITRFLENKTTDYEWDDFVSIPLTDQELDKIRRECLSLPDRFPSVNSNEYCSAEGSEYLKQLLEQLKKNL